MKKEGKRIIILMILTALLAGNIGSGEADMRSCNNRDDLKAYTGVPTSGIVIEQIEQIPIVDYDCTEVIIVCKMTEEHALDFFLEGDSVFHEPPDGLYYRLCQERLSSYGISREMILSSTMRYLEMTIEGWIYPYRNICFSYCQGDEINYIIISCIPCTLIIDTEGILIEGQQ